MKIGIRNSPHLDTLVSGINRVDTDVKWTSTYDTGADWYLCWGWPQAEQVARDNGGQHSKIICVDAHPIALMAGNRTGARILQLGNWGALARYPAARGTDTILVSADRSVPGGHVLVLGQVYSAQQREQGLVDVWHTGGYDQWVRSELAKPGRRLRKHPRIWAIENNGEIQPSLADDLAGCSGAVSWNSTAGFHARLLGYPATATEAHGWAHMETTALVSLLVLPEELRSGQYWAHVYRPWLEARAP